MRPETLGIIGLGALGGSIARSARGHGVRRVLGYSRRPAGAVRAVRAGAITEIATNLRYLLRESDVVVLAVPPGEVLGLLPTAARDLRADAWCTDVATVKAAVTRAASAAGLADRFAGSHPRVTPDGTGFGAAEASLLEHAVVYVTPVDDRDRPAREIADFWTALGADPVMIDAAQHDRTVAWTTHLPHVLAAALAAACGMEGPRGVTYDRPARDLTRRVPLAPDLWRDTLLLNREAVLDTLDALEGAAGSLRRALAEGDAEAVDAWLRHAVRWREGMGP